MTTLRIKITKDILEKSKFCDTNPGKNCAISLAIRDIFPNAHIGENSIDPFFDDERVSDSHRIWLPKEASSFIRKFDHTCWQSRPDMDEFEFDIFISDSVLERIDIEEVKTALAEHPTLCLL
jgi:hypothetical protein